MKRPSFFTKCLIIISLAIFQLSQVLVFPLPVAQAANPEAGDFGPLMQAERPRGDTGTLYDLIVLLVDKDIKNEDDMMRRVQRYGEDLLDSNPQTDIKIMFYDDESDSVESVAAAMENLYYNGDGGNPNQLTGVIVIGDIPLPVVNKNGNRFVSMFPYTDFIDKAYVYNKESGDFERNEEVGFPKPEAWHGVIKAPNMDDLAKFFDKNHLYYTGDPEFSEFDRKMFFGDLVHEEEQMNDDVYKHYLDYLEAAEDIAYMRYNKFWASEFTQKAAESVNIDLSAPVDADNDLADAREDFAAAVSGGNTDTLSQIPDIYSKTIIDQFLIPYYKIFTKYISSVNDWADYTGRYDARDVDSLPGLISIKDDYTRYYLKSVNDALERKTNEIVEKIAEPLPLLESVSLSGNFNVANDFGVQVENLTTEEADFFLAEDQLLRFHYLNELDDKLYLNGIDAELLSNAQQCSVFLGSTESRYFDENLQYNPKAVGGDYSILTRALRSDNIMTLNVVTAGVNTRLLSPEELLRLTGGAYGGTEVEGGYKETGAVIEDDAQYAIPAFIDSTLGSSDDGYVGVFEETFRRGDVIVAINDENIGFANSFDDAIEKAYKNVVTVVDAINKEELENLANFNGSLATFKEDPADPPFDAFGNAVAPPPPLRILKTPQEIINDNRLRSRSVDAVIGYLKIEYYRGPQKLTETLSFTVEVNEDTDEIKFASKEDPQGPIEVAVLLPGMELPNNFGWDTNSDGALFNLYENDTLGYGGEAYDPSAGCNAKSAGRNSDRCLGKVATMPIFDPGGSLAPIKMSIPGQGDVLKFPVNVKKTNAYVNSGRPEDYENAVDAYAFPENKNFEDIDEVIFDACYGTGLPSYSAFINGQQTDSNPYSFVLDLRTAPLEQRGADGLVMNPPQILDRDFYGQLLKGFGDFVASTRADEPDYEHNRAADSSDFSPKAEIWKNFDNINAGQIILNTDGSVVTLKNFSDRYGIFDGKDNDDDGLADYRLEDRNEDGEPDTRVYDFDEADPRYGIPAENMGEIARKMLAHEKTYRVPYSLEGFPEQWKDFDEDITLNVSPNVYEEKTIPGFILHNEPTNHTIMTQLEAKGTLSLPIDDPRYVAFIAEPAGDPVKFYYINMFDENIKNLSDIGRIIEAKAMELAQVEGAYRVFGRESDPADHTTEEIKDEILNRYFAPVVTNLLDDPLQGFNLNRANTKKLGDALAWRNMDIDEKHHYVLEYYLNGDSNHNSFINDGALFPAPFGFETSAGYEASYLVLDGKEDFFQMQFNKDQPEETDERFDPLAQGIGAGADDEDVADEEEEDEDFEFVWLDQFLKELEAFVDGFTSVPNFEQACGFNVTIDDAIGGENNGISKVDRFELDVDKFIASVKGGEEITVTGTAYDADGNVVQQSPDIINLDVSGDAFYLSNGNGKTLNNGEVVFKLRPNQVPGTASLSLTSSGGGSSNGLQVSSTNKEVKLVMEESQIVADGESILNVEAQIFDDNGQIVSEEVNEVQFSLDNNLASFVGPSTVSTVNGKASVQIKSGTKSGQILLSADVTTDSYPSPKEPIDIVAGPVVSIDVDADTFLLVANNQSKSHIEITLRDAFGNIANNDFSQVAVFANTIAEMDPKADTNKEIIGTQISTFEGRASLDLLAKDKIGTANMIFLLFDYELGEEFATVGEDWEKIDFNGRVGATVSFEVVDKVGMEVKILDNNSQPANSVAVGENKTLKFEVKLKHGNEKVSTYNGPIDFNILTENLGDFVSKPPIKMVEGQLLAENVKFKPDKSAGKAEIQIEIPGFVSKVVSFDVVPGEAKTIQLNASADSMTTSDGDSVFLEAVLLDEFGNVAENDEGKRIEFSATAATAELVNFDPAAAISEAGKATTTIFSNGKSGKVNLAAIFEGLETGTATLDIVKRIDGPLAEDFAPRSLYMSLLGGNFGNEMARENLAQRMLFNGQTQAVSAVTSSADGDQKLLGVDSKGQINLLSNSIEAELVAATDEKYHQIIFSDVVEDSELASLFFVPEEGLEMVLLEEGDVLSKQNGRGIFLKPLGPMEGEAEISEKEDGVYIEQGGERKVKIDSLGRVSINDDGFGVRLPVKEDNLKVSSFSLVVTQADNPVLLINFKNAFDTNIRRLSKNSRTDNLFPGFHIKQLKESERYELVNAFSGNSSDAPLGAYLIDKENPLDPSQAPVMGDDFGLGFEGDNKHMLLFSAGNSVGESQMPYASEAGITYGDPTIRLEVEEDLVSDATHYSKDLGKVLYNGQTPIQDLINFDINGDERDDLLMVYENGIIRLLENVNTRRRFLDRGEILNIYSGVTSLTKIDINNDGLDDLVAGTNESCHADEECVSLFLNIGGGFDRKKLDINLEGQKLYDVKAGDVNADECEDLVISDSGGKILFFYNQKDGGQCKGLEKEPSEDFNFGFSIKQNENQADNLFINYPGMNLVENKIIQFILESSTPAPGDALAAQAQATQAALSANTELASADIPPLVFPKEFNFMHLPSDAVFSGSTKQAIDLNGENVKLGDTINYVITLRNNSGQNIFDLRLSDTTSASMTLDMESLKCLDAGCEDALEWQETGTSLRSNIIKNISVPAGGVRTIQYSMVVDKLPKVKFDLGHDFANYPEDNNGDERLDVMVRPDINPDGILTYLYSTEKNGRTVHERFDDTPDLEEDQQVAPDGISDTIRNAQSTGLTPELEGELDGLMDQQTQDKDYDGCSDLWNSVMTDYENSADAIATGVENALSLLRCSGGGCVPIPYNYAFLVPDGATPGFAPLAFYPSFPPLLGAPVVLPAVSNNPAPPTTFRLYVSPTITAGLGTAICVGPSSPAHGAACYAFAVPGGIPGSSGVCDAVLGEITDAIAKAKESVVDPAVGMSAVITDGSETIDNEDIDFETNFADDNDPISAAAKVNIKIPGFPSIITNWVDNQIDEIYNKLLDFPKLYIILPDIVPFISDNVKATSEVNFQSFNDFATSLAAIPLIQIEGKEILVRVPAVSRNEIEKYKDQWKKWKEDMNQQLQDRIAFWNCDENPNKKSVCDKIVLDISQFIDGVNQLLDLMDQLANLPRQILNWRHLEAKYATQIICYLDAVTNFTGGYIKRQQKVIESWMKAAKDAVRTFKEWRAVLDLAVEYQASCDQCKNDRFSKLALLLQIFAALPEPPVIPLPKWPDLVVDLSQIKTGVQIVWPDVTFRPEPIHLPDIPQITLPEILPSVAIEIPGFDVPDLPTLFLPDLPDLPPLPLPQLPDLPRPPKIPKLPNLVAEIVAKLKPIFKIVCLLKNGLIPVPEAGLETEIETLTQPSIQAVLPIIKSLAVQWPGIQYDYVREIRITSKISFDIETEFIYVQAKKGFKIWNDKVEAMVENINKFTTVPYGQILSRLVQQAIDEQVQKALDELPDDDLPAGIEIETDKPSSYIPDIESGQIDRVAMDEFIGVHPEIAEFTKNLQELNTLLEEYVASMPQEQLPDSYNLIATQDLLSSDDPILNRSLSEVEASIAMEDLPDNPAIQRVANLRNELIAYTKNLNNSNGLLENISDIEDFNRVLVENDQDLPRFASLGEPTTIDGGTIETSFFGEGVEELLQNAAYDLDDKRDLLAADIEVNQQELAQGGSSSSGPAIGFYVVGANGINENVLNYTAELKKETHVLFGDVDLDRDTDIILSMGGDVYLKQSYEFEPDWENGDLIDSRTSVGEFVYEGGTSIQGLTAPYINNGKVDLNWQPAGEGTMGYEIVLSDSIYPSERLRGSITRYLALTNPIDSPESIALFEVLDIPPPTEDDKSILVLSSKENPAVTLEVPNGNYYARVYAVDKEGRRSFGSNQAIVAPQSCADKEAPFAVIPASDFSLSIFEEMTLDVSNSFDADGKIIEYYLEPLPYETEPGLVFTRLPQKMGNDINPFIDSDGDVIPWNDLSDPVFTLGPFTNEGDVGKHEFVLHVVDQSGNSSEQKITVDVFVPEISLDPTFGRTKVAKGEVTPNRESIPFALMRERFIYRVVNGKLNLVPRTEQVASGETDIDGRYELLNFEEENLIIVEDMEGNIVAEIDPETGNIGALAEGHNAIVYPAQIPDTPTRVEIVGPGGEVLGTIYLVADPNIDVTVMIETEITAANYEPLRGVNIDDTDGEDNFRWILLPANDPANPGGGVLVNEESGESLVVTDTAGNIIILNESVTLTLKENDYKEDPLIVLVSVDGEVVAEVYISPTEGVFDSVSTQIIAEADLPFSSPNTPSAAAVYRPDILIHSAYQDILTSLDLEANETFEPEALVTRAEFVRVLLNMLCIVPREPEAYQAYDAGMGYADMPFDRENLDKDYPYVKEASLLGLVEGYKGDRDVASGLLPFRPGDTITRAEAVKIILRSLEMKGVVDLTGVSEGNPWYGDFFRVAQNLTPYMTDETLLANNFIITPEEAALPLEEMSFEELLIMVQRVLEIYSCREVDDDADGMSDFCEEKYKVDDPNEDIDEDGISNAQECLYGLNPQSPDDNGYYDNNGQAAVDANFEAEGGGEDGADDGGEGAGRQSEAENGIYVTPAECNTCPCVSTFIDKADIMPGDVFFPVIFKEYAQPVERLHIFSKGNEVTITK